LQRVDRQVTVDALQCEIKRKKAWKH